MATTATFFTGPPSCPGAFQVFSTGLLAQPAKQTRAMTERKMDGIFMEVGWISSVFNTRPCFHKTKQTTASGQNCSRTSTPADQPPNFSLQKYEQPTPIQRRGQIWPKKSRTRRAFAV